MEKLLQPTKRDSVSPLDPSSTLQKDYFSNSKLSSYLSMVHSSVDIHSDMGINAPIFKTDQGTSAKDTNTQTLQNTGDTLQDEQNPIALKNQNKDDVDQHLLLRKLVSSPSQEEKWKKVQQILKEDIQNLQKDGDPLTN